MMRMKAVLAGGIVTAALALAGCSSSGGDSGTPSSYHLTTATASAPATPTPATNLTGTFAGLNGKKVVGDVTISGDTVTLANFSSDEGPDLHLYLANGTSEADVTSGIEIDKVAWNKGAQSFTITGGVDASQYTDIVVHCDKAKAVFGAAKLGQ